ncbi:MAG TPA: rhodanese-like domain-containing protein [Dermatophilaceae bacterium]|nr:rhodanese-like domain-containing protein [Dermatophilaceae bacterium]
MTTTTPDPLFGGAMIFTQYYLDCLSQASYLVADEATRQAVVVDPRRDVAEYLEDAAARGLTIVGVVNTHFHADFVSGHLELARESGAWIGYGEAARADFPVRHLADGERIVLGDVVLEVMATPGHTPESISVLVFEHADDEVPYGVLTGDALFIGDVGRPDLLASVGVSAEELGRMLYHSVQSRLMGLPDAVRVFPAHGAGSACGKNLSTERQSTIGEQRAVNYACQPMTEEDFLAVVTEGQPAAPGYFLYNATLNKQQRDLRDPHAVVAALDHAEVERALADGAVVHDARDVQEFAAGHLRGSVNVPADGRMAETAGMVLTPDQRIVLVAPEGQEQDVAIRLARIGYDHVVGHVADVEGYLLTHEDQVERASRLPVAEADAVLARGDVQVVDLRNAGELAGGMVPGAAHIPLAALAQRAEELDPTRPVVVYCAGGWRSSVGASVLRARGFVDVSDILGGFGAWDRAHAVAS